MSVLYSPTLKYSDGELRRNQEMDSNKGHTQQSCHQKNSGLLRYRSAPTSLLASFVDNNSSHGCVNEETFGGDDQQQQQQQQRYHPSLGSEMETMLAKLISSNNGWSNSESLHEFGGKPVKQEAGESVPQGPQQNGYSSELIYQSQEIQGLPNGCLSSGQGFDGSSSVISSMASENSKMGPGNCSNLIRQRSSPAEFFSNFSAKNGFAAFGEVGSFRGCDVSNGQATTSTGGLNGNITLTRKSSFSRRMPQIAENGNESLEASCVESRNLGNDNGSTTKCHMPSFTSDFWDSSTFGAQKTASENDEIMFSISDALETQNADFGHQNLGLSHQWSFPSSTKMAAIEKFLQVQGSVPCKIRAKRGFATHPRSIAERVRRTRISERIKKLQELFPKSDKQTSTADMLDLAVDYIKDLQEQVKILTDTRAKCTCSSIQKQY